MDEKEIEEAKKQQELLLQKAKPKRMRVTLNSPSEPITRPPGIGTWVGYNFYDLR